MCFAFIATILQLKHQYNLKNGKKSALGRLSSVMKDSKQLTKIRERLSNEKMANSIDDEPQASTSDQGVDNPAFGVKSKKNQLDLDCCDDEIAMEPSLNSGDSPLYDEKHIRFDL